MNLAKENMELDLHMFSTEDWHYCTKRQLVVTNRFYMWLNIVCSTQNQPLCLLLCMFHYDTVVTSGV